MMPKSGHSVKVKPYLQWVKQTVFFFTHPHGLFYPNNVTWLMCIQAVIPRFFSASPCPLKTLILGLCIFLPRIEFCLLGCSFLALCFFFSLSRFFNSFTIHSAPPSWVSYAGLTGIVSTPSSLPLMKHWISSPCYNFLDICPQLER